LTDAHHILSALIPVIVLLGLGVGGWMRRQQERALSTGLALAAESARLADSPRRRPGRR
jgi:hypothetical protein